MNYNSRVKVGSRRGTPKRLSRQAIGRSFGPSRDQLPEITSSFTLKKRFRYIADQDVNDLSITRDMMVALFGIGYHSALPSNGLYRLIDSYKVLNVTIRSLPVIGTSSTVVLEWRGTQAKDVRHQDTSMGINPALISSSPPAGTACSFWSSVAGNEVLFTISCPSDSVVDLTVDLVLTDGLGAFYGTVGTATDSAFSVKPLDSIIGTSAGHLQPQGYKYILTY
jgi:hypothetical protein